VATRIFPPIEEEAIAMRNRGRQHDQATAPVGWVVRTSQGYYTGKGRSQIERWTAFPKLAKVYTRQGWAQKIAERFGGKIVPVRKPAHPSD
jgi:hypothetical protein